MEFDIADCMKEHDSFLHEMSSIINTASGKGARRTNAIRPNIIVHKRSDKKPICRCQSQTILSFPSMSSTTLPATRKEH